ncbi:MAG TPA: hypothetical protein VK700_04070 [Steroidobacteraceae bacterium]|nr:hypothetical protein [Steroidobacteraceae bacterium]
MFVPGRLSVEYVLPAVRVETPIPEISKVAAYWTEIQNTEHASSVSFELNIGLEERREEIRSGAWERFKAERAVVQKATDAEMLWVASRANSIGALTGQRMRVQA